MSWYCYWNSWITVFLCCVNCLHMCRLINWLFLCIFKFVLWVMACLAVCWFVCFLFHSILVLYSFYGLRNRWWQPRFVFLFWLIITSRAVSFLFPYASIAILTTRRTCGNIGETFSKTVLLCHFRVFSTVESGSTRIQYWPQKYCSNNPHRYLCGTQNRRTSHVLPLCAAHETKLVVSCWVRWNCSLSANAVDFTSHPFFLCPIFKVSSVKREMRYAA